MEKLGISQSELARRIGTTSAMATILFKESNQSSRLVPEVHAALGWPPPPLPESVADTPASPATAPAPGAAPEIVYLFERLDAQGQATVLATARRELDRIIGVAKGKTPKSGR